MCLPPSQYHGPQTQKHSEKHYLARSHCPSFSFDQAHRLKADTTSDSHPWGFSPSHLLLRSITTTFHFSLVAMGLVLGIFHYWLGFVPTAGRLLMELSHRPARDPRGIQPSKGPFLPTLSYLVASISSWRKYGTPCCAISHDQLPLLGFLVLSKIDLPH